MIVTSLLGGVFMDTYGVIRGVRICLLAMLVVSIASAVLRWRYITETLDASSRKVERIMTDTVVQRRLPSGLMSMRRELLVLTMVAALSGFSMRIVWSFMVVYAVEVVGISKTQWGIIGTFLSIISTALTLPGGVLSDKIGRKPCITISRILYPISIIGFTYSKGFWHLLSVNALRGAAQGFGGLVWGPMGGPVWQALVADLTPPEDRGRIMGLMGSIAGLVSTPASWVGGFMYDNISPALPFQASFIIDIIGTIIFIAFLKEPNR
jgi:MFS family permease